MTSRIRSSRLRTTSALPYLRVMGPGGVSVGVSGLVITYMATCKKERNGRSVRMGDDNGVRLKRQKA